MTEPSHSPAAQRPQPAAAPRPRLFPLCAELFGISREAGERIEAARSTRPIRTICQTWWAL